MAGLSGAGSAARRPKGSEGQLGVKSRGAASGGVQGRARLTWSAVDFEGAAPYRRSPHAAGPMKSHQPIHFAAGLEEVATRYDVILCDVWGVIHNGIEASQPAYQALMRFREAGGCVIL